MNLKIETEQFRIKPGTQVDASSLPTSVDLIYDGKKDYKKQLEDYTEEIHDLQNMMYAHNRHALLLVFQGMDSAGKDGAIRHVMTGINPAGVQVFTFKRPSEMELDHDWMWRCARHLPERGRIGIFNRSYYEEVLVVRVHPGILTGSQRIPAEEISDVDKVFQDRLQDMVNFEDMWARNGYTIIKFFLNVSKEEQRKRLIARIDTPEKNWKMNPGDIEERGFWDDYMAAYSDLLSKTSKERAPWYAIPADDKKNARLIISQIVLNHIKGLKMQYPDVTDEFVDMIKGMRSQLEK